MNLRPLWGIRFSVKGQFMSLLAVDTVILPNEELTNKAIEVNARLVKEYGEKIVLNKENCLPHISLAMGCMKESDIEAIGKVLEKIAEENPTGVLKAMGIKVTQTSSGNKVSVIEIEKKPELLSLHEKVIEELTPYLSYDVSADMIYGQEVAWTTLAWIRDYPEKAGFENFFPHITVGYGEASDASFPTEFTASKLALFHLGNHCTCRNVLVWSRIQ